MAPDQQPQPKSPEQLAREREDRVREDARREAAWRARRRRYAVLALAVGAFLPAASVALAGGIVTASLTEWLTSVDGVRTIVWAGVSGLGCAALMVWRGLGVLPGIVLGGAAFAGFVALAGERATNLLPTLFVLLALFILSGALVGFIIGLEEEGG